MRVLEIVRNRKKSLEQEDMKMEITEDVRRSVARGVLYDNIFKALQEFKYDNRVEKFEKNVQHEFAYYKQFCAMGCDDD